MNPTLDRFLPPPENRLFAVIKLALEMAQERSLDALLRKVIDVAVAIRDVALARVYLIKPGDICPACPQRSVCPDQKQCLHAVICGAEPLVAGEDPSKLDDDPYRRIPLGVYQVGRSATLGETVFVPKEETKEWIASPAWAALEEIGGHGCFPIRAKGSVLGVLVGLFRGQPSNESMLLWQVIADHLGAAISNAGAFAEIERLRQQLQLENEYLREEIDTEGDFGDILGRSPALNAMKQQIDLVAPTDATVLIQGESGTGKELVAREIHKRSRRSHKPMVKVNCAAIPHELYESEFFGHVKGAFTGAIRDRAGRFEVADGGTLFLDEVGEIPLVLQSKLLRVLQEGSFERVGEEKTRRVDVRILAATNRDLKEEMAAGHVRGDLYYRLNVFPIQAAPLRERKEDIPILAAHFLEHACQRIHLPRIRLTRANFLELQQYDWPGNIRELQNVLERAAIMARRGGKLCFDLPREEPPASPSSLLAGGEGLPRQATVLSDADIRRLERDNIEAALRQSGGRIRGPGGAAELLGLKPTTLTARIKALGIQKPKG